MVPLPFDSFTDADTGRPQTRLVNLESGSYRVAKEYMIRLEREDFADPEKLESIAGAAGMTAAAFHRRYGYLVGVEAPA